MAGKMSAQADLNEVRRARESLERISEELSSTKSELAEVETRSKVAVQTEDADEVTRLWQAKHRLSEHVHELTQECSGIQKQLQTTVEQALTELTRRASEDLRRLRHEQESACNELGAVLSRAQELVAGLKNAPAAWEEIQRDWQAEVSSLLSNAGLAGTAVPPSLNNGGSSRRSAPVMAPNPAYDPGTQRKWSVYDPDKGKIVESADELLRLLARWYPQKSPQERIEEFFTLSHAEVMPEALREELAGAGFTLPDA